MEGESAFSNNAAVTVANDDQVTVSSTALLGAYPNPFTGSTLIQYQVKGNHDVTIEIYNIKGQLIKKLVQESKATGMNTVSWNGTNENEQAVPSGVYFYKMKSGNFSSTKKVILLK
jgi:flagellar hook assembly protein FlgD